MVLALFKQHRFLFLTPPLGIRTAGAKTAAGGDMGNTRNLPLFTQLPLRSRLPKPGDRLQKHPGIGMGRS